MTSSLVGSEMCIRDSARASNIEFMQALERQWTMAKPERVGPVDKHETVSYTHLTLPTICSV
eukprot:1666078-Prorocentrum_lima.AAC.1